MEEGLKLGRLELRGHWNYLGLKMVTEVTTGRWGGRGREERILQWTLGSKLSREEGKIKLGMMKWNTAKFSCQDVREEGDSMGMLNGLSLVQI